MKIKELYLKNFRCFDELTINFPTDYTVFIGNNGAGKSSILNALQIVLDNFVSAAQLDIRKPSKNFNDMPIQESDVRIETVPIGSTLTSKSQYPLLLRISVQKSDGSIENWQRGLKSYLTSDDDRLGYIRHYVSVLQNQVADGENIILPIIAYYGTRRQWDKTDDRPEKNLLFIPQMNGYVNALSAKPFNIEVMRHWFSRMLLISRKKSVSEFQAVRNAIACCYRSIDDRKNLKDVIIDYDAEKEDIEIQMYFNGGTIEVLPLHYLSDGAKSILAIVADIAYRMAILNPHLLDKVITDTDGIVLIDEIDMHLHPSWQRKIIDSLHKTFPKVQFIFTTHSPTVLTNVPKENIQILKEGKIFNTETNTYGRDVNSILREIMYTEIRPSEVKEKLTAFSNAIDDSDLDTAETLLKELRTILQRVKNDIGR